MWSTPTQNGKTVFRERYKDPMTGKTKTATVTLQGADSPRLRKVAFDRLQAIINEKTYSDNAEAVRLKDLLDRYINYQSTVNRLSTVKRNKITLSICVDLIGKDVLLDKLTAAFIKDQLMKHTQNPVTLNEYVKRIKAMLRWGYENDYVKNTAVYDKLKNFRVEKHSNDYLKPEDKYLEPEELEKVLAYMKDSQEYWWYLTRFLVLSGLRIGEAIALEPSDIGKCITVSKAFNVVTKETNEPKTACSNRQVYIQPELAELIKEIKRYNRNMDILFGVRSQFFFHGKDGDRISYGAYNKYVREVTERVIGEKRTTHAFRHTHASILFGEGVSIDTISRRLGHENSMITKRIYLHIIEKVREKDAEILSKIRLLS